MRTLVARAMEEQLHAHVYVEVISQGHDRLFGDEKYSLLYDFAYTFIFIYIYIYVCLHLYVNVSVP